MKKILLTGATGFLGSHVLGALVKKGYSVVILTRSCSDTWRIQSLLKKAKLYNIDDEPLEQIFAENKIDCIIHLATLYKKIDTPDDMSAMLFANVLFPTKLLELGLRHNVKAFINTGTFFEYDCTVLPVSERNPEKPYNFYAKTKIAFEAVLKTYSDELKVVTLKLFSPYGEKDNHKVIPYIIKSAINDEPAVLSAGFQKLDFIYAGDIANAYLAAIEYLKLNKPTYSVFNIGSGTPVSIREVVSIVEERLGRSIKKEWGERAFSDNDLVFSDISRARDILNWSPKISLVDGLKATIEHYKG